MAFPHPQSREDHERKEDISRRRRVLRKLLKRAIEIAVDRDSHDDVNPAQNRSLGGNLHSHVSFLVPKLLQLADDPFQASDELAPAIGRALVSLLLIGKEARVLHAYECS